MTATTSRAGSPGARTSALTPSTSAAAPEAVPAPQTNPASQTSSPASQTSPASRTSPAPAARTLSAPGRRRWTDLAVRAGVPVALLGAWAAGSASGAIQEQIFPSPRSVVTAFVELATTGVLWENLSASLGRLAVGFAVGASLGLVLGTVAGLFRLGDQLLDPTLQMLRTIPFLAITPLLILWFGIDERPKIIIIAAASLFPLYLNTHSGVRNVDRKILEAGRVFGLRGVSLVRQVVLPEAIPSILVGLRVSLSTSLLALIVAELTNAPRGLGYLMTSAQQYFQTDVLVVIVAIYALWGLAVDLLVRGLERVLLPYKRRGARR